VKNRKREICTSGTVGGEGGNILTYPAMTIISAGFATPLGATKDRSRSWST
jgi:hypothetical protein